MADQSLAGAGLFDSSGPQGYAKEVKSVSSALTGVGTAANTVATQSNKAFTAVLNQLTQIIAKGQTAAKVLAGVQVPTGTGGAAASSWSTAGTQGNTTNNGGSQSGGAMANYFNAGAYGIGADGTIGYGTFGGVNGGGQGSGVAGGVGGMGGGTPNGGAQPGGDSSSGTSLTDGVLGGAVAASGAVQRVGNNAAARGLSWTQLGASVASLQGKAPTGSSALAAENYAKQFTGWGGQAGNPADVGNLNAGLQALVGSGGAKFGSAKYTSQANSAGALANISQAIGGNVTFSDAASVQSYLTSSAGAAALSKNGLSQLAAGGNQNIFSVATGTDQRIAQQMVQRKEMTNAQYQKQGGFLSTSQIAQQSGQGGALYNTLVGGLNLDPQVAQTVGSYLEQFTRTGNTKQGPGLGSTNLTSANVQSQLKTLGFGNTATDKDIAASQDKSDATSTSDQTAANALAGTSLAAAKAEKSLTGLSTTLDKVVGELEGLAANPKATATDAAGHIVGSVGSAANSAWNFLMGHSGGTGSQGGGVGNSGGNIGMPTTAVPTKTTGGTGSQVVADAEKYLGVPYLWGGTDPSKGLDCSGLTQLAYAQVGVHLPRTTYQQVKVGTQVQNINQAAPGDLLFFAGSDGTPTNPGHVGIYIGGNKMIDAPYTGTDVRIESAGDPVAIRRILGGNGNSGTSSTVSGMSAGVGSTAGNVPNSFNNTGLGEGSTNSESASLSTFLTPGMSAGAPTLPGVGGLTGTVGNSNGGTTTAAVTTGAAGGNPTQNQAIAKTLANQYGWGSGTNWSDLVLLWTKESGWSNTAKNPSSGAYGIAQALGHGPTNQYPAGPANPPPAGTSNASAQISWGLDYIKGRYGSPAAAWAHEMSSNWYEGGSMYIDSDQVAQLHRGEMVIRSGAAAAMRMNQMSAPSSGGINFEKGAVVFTMGSGVGTGSGNGSTSSVPNQQEMEQAATYFFQEFDRRRSMKAMAEA